MPAKSALYDEDFYAWSNQQAELLRAGRLQQADIEHIAEEIESMGKTEKREPDGSVAASAQMAISTRQACSELGSEHRGPTQPACRSP